MMTDDDVSELCEAMRRQYEANKDWINERGVECTFTADYVNKQVVMNTVITVRPPVENILLDFNLFAPKDS
jgi:hypothetical protein